MGNIAVLGHLVQDICIEANSRLRYNAIANASSLDTALLLAEKDDETLGEKASVKITFGGPALNWAQYLVPDDAVKIMSVAGNGTQGQELRILLQETLGLNIEGVKFYGGTLPRFGLAYTPSFKRKQHWDTKIFWEGNVADEHFKEIEPKKNFLQDTDVLALPIAEPEVAKKAAEVFCDANPSGKIFYNPGRFLERLDFSFEETYFQEILRKANWVVLNRAEAAAVQRNMHLSSIQRLFDSGERLELIIVTRDKEGSYIYERRGEKKWNYTPTEQLSVNPGQALGAGDAYAATLLSKILHNYSISDAQHLASTAAEDTLKYIGALNERRILGETSVSDLQTVTRFRRPEAK